ncbi:N-acetylneuraminate synthase family protein [Polynucleobacter sp. UB-Siik-W21]|uniref:N-acetylneuraminate synthase family protein n=1 Tax=Polynucleobacter sp. UB-Siik-W21 TaxID=1855646 RepID=UPI001BFCE7EF|nr:N-acetylneuraminate synthase family protein [Polynucleobacter sp. UB-Siik-W21]QWD70705.1 N-acetylneuraminate synthase family protein [Polynucleobacter sp. UB-Siik-W21]
MKFNTEIKIGDKLVTNKSPTFIIAEAGVNHGGDLDLAKKLILLAAKAGADAVKFQTFRADSLILKDVEKAPYQKISTGGIYRTQHDMLKILEVTPSQNIVLKNFCKDNGILFLTTPFEEESLDSLDELNLPAYKIASTDLTNLPFLELVAKKGKPILLSTGMSYMSEIESALECIYPYNRDVIVLHCTANYPISNDEVNLNVINSLKKNFEILVGFSDHTVGVGAAPYAIPMGAKVLEKHFTLGKDMLGPDHKASLSPDELIELVQVVKKVDKYIGKSIKNPTLSETLTRKSLQKCLVAKVVISAGEPFTATNITAKRTGGVGISPLYFHDICGKLSPRSFKVDEILEL